MNQSLKTHQICCMDTGKHIGEYIENKLHEQGRTKTWLAKRMHTTRQNLANLFAKDELLPSKVEEIKEAVLDPYFFDDFFIRNPELYLGPKKSHPDINEPPAPYTRVERGSGYKVIIEVDPISFDHDSFSKTLDELDEELVQKMIADFQKKSKK